MGKIGHACAGPSIRTEAFRFESGPYFCSSPGLKATLIEAPPPNLEPVFQIVVKKCVKEQ
jgi:hypothetical protein